MQDQRTYCQQCGTWRFKEAHELCFHCAKGSSVDTPQIEQSIVFGGITVDAPGFAPEQFERAMARAIADALEVHVDQTGQHIVCHAGVNGGYFTPRHTCNCKAGQCGQVCKLRALLIFHLDVREPALRRQWQAAERNASRSAVAA